MPILTENTSFTKDVQGRYLCNSFDEAKQTDFRRFDIIIIGGGSFGASMAEQCFQRGTKNAHRVLLLEAGQYVLPEHIQNLPPINAKLAGANATTIEEMRIAWNNKFGSPPPPFFDRNIIEPGVEVWGLPWHSRAGAMAEDPKDKRFAGLAYCIGGRSLFWGGWSPALIESEFTDWPLNVKQDLINTYFKKAGEQIGTDTANDFIKGELHSALRKQLFDKITTVPDALPLASEDFLEAPLAVQSNQPRSGLFPFNKFSSVPVLFEAVRVAQKESPNDDSKKRLMVVPNCHIIKLHVDNLSRVDSIQTSLGDIEVNPNSIVIIALGTIESTRLALLSFPNSNGLTGKNLMAHLRSNLDIRIPREALSSLSTSIKELQSSALFVKGRHTHTDGSFGHFHLQITASGLGQTGTDSEAELWKKIPDIDQLDIMNASTDTHVVITIRGIGEMTGNKTTASHSHIVLDPERDEFGMNRAIITLGLVQKDKDLWDAMDKAADEVAKIFAGSLQDKLEILSKRRDGLGTTHHEGGTLWMGEDGATSVTNHFGRFHEVRNAFAAGPSLLPNMGSPNPMLSGIALVRRTAEIIIPPDKKPIVEPDFQELFNGVNINDWKMAGAGQFVVESKKDDDANTYGVLRSQGGMGLLWYPIKQFKDFNLRLEYHLSKPDDNSGVFIRFPDPGNDPLVAVNNGYEIQIDDFGKAPDNSLKNPLYMTGAVYNFSPASHLATNLVGEWNSLEILVQAQHYIISLNGEKVNDFTGSRLTEGFIGIQNHGVGSEVFFRNIRIKEL